jgi:hypothetical protein
MSAQINQFAAYLQRRQAIEVSRVDDVDLLQGRVKSQRGVLHDVVGLFPASDTVITPFHLLGDPLQFLERQANQFIAYERIASVQPLNATFDSDGGFRHATTFDSQVPAPLVGPPRGYQKIVSPIDQFLKKRCPLPNSTFAGLINEEAATVGGFDRPQARRLRGISKMTAKTLLRRALICAILTAAPAVATAQSAGTAVDVGPGHAHASGHASGDWQFVDSSSQVRGGTSVGKALAIGRGPNGIAISHSIGVNGAGAGVGHNFNMSIGPGGAHVSHGGVNSQGLGGRVMAGGSAQQGPFGPQGGSTVAGFGRSTQAHSSSHTSGRRHPFANGPFGGGMVPGDIVPGEIAPGGARSSGFGPSGFVPGTVGPWSMPSGPMQIQRNSPQRRAPSGHPFFNRR